MPNATTLNRTFILPLLFAFLAGVLTASVALFLFRQPTKERERPHGIPAEAVWSGGPDGGEWFQCKAANEYEFDCTVYADVTGAIVEGGRYRLQSHSAISSGVRPELLATEGVIEVRAWLVKSGK